MINLNENVNQIPWESEDTLSWELQRQELLGNNSLEYIRIGSSEVGSACGVNKYNSQFSLFQIKVGRIEPFEGNCTTEVGKVLEPVIANMIQYWDSSEDIDTSKTALVRRMRSSDIRRTIHKANFFLTNDKYPQLLSSLDYYLPKENGCPITGEVLETDAIIEIKNIGFNSYQQWKSEGRVSDYYFAQLQQQLMVSELKHAYLFALVENQYLVCYKIEPDIGWYEFIDQTTAELSVRILKYRNIDNALYALDNRSEEYAELVAQRDDLEPETDGSQSTTDTLTDLFGDRDSGEYIDGDDGDYQMAQQYLELNEVEKDTKLQKNNVKNYFLNRMKEHRTLKVDNITVKRGSRFSITRKKGDKI